LFLVGDPKKSIRIGELFIPFDSFNKRMMLFCTPLIFESPPIEGAENYIYSRTGTVTLLKYKGSFFVVTAKHCLEGFNCEDIRIFPGSSPIKSLPLNARFFVNNQPDEEIDDVYIYRVDNTLDLNLKTYFFPLSAKDNNTQKLISSFMVSDPRQEGDINYDEPHIKGICAMPACQIDLEYKSYAKFYKKATFKKPLNHTLDGASGGAMFSIMGEIDNPYVEYEGMIVRGNEEAFHFIDSQFIIKSLDYVVEQGG